MSKTALVVATAGALVSAGTLSASALTAPASLDPGIRVVGLTQDGKITSVDTGRDRASTPKAIRGLSSGDRVVGIDYRPAVDKLWGVALTPAKTLKVFKISAATGRTYSRSFLRDADGDKITSGASSYGVDFNPTVDRMRIVSSSGENYRVNVATGETTVDGRLKLAAGSGTPRVVSAAYANSIKGATETALYDLEITSNRIHTQAPPNDGTLNAGARLARDIRATTAFDIATVGGRDTALVSNTSRGQTKIYRVNLDRGTVTGTSSIADRAIVDLAAPTGR
ncbi:MAG: DUF4394 domain-containing protein [Nocardioidaceae bacterium]|nr:DUF4394 domain-containing protein [Nocardioidaceae bacterium]